ncbi:acyl-CoA synthetase (AMP-forming)/AMP-acid ligase II [Catenuloplanes nepalensis]|uniref:Acyl-CoA synthetase (AMP-forming)/AMP-acid ligase II n=1 Tax=Catenuloplanes nepalensis TaxID=587533 RepID=A0ABT9MU57_9ACTN|nr:AMP-binding protein [Catenuloplanes nepalensis]MDP9794981.1 acyl-CoA synthetase (AMP-forming)/AMP-acid ligase II [Catenuloplanes nepalensis]
MTTPAAPVRPADVLSAVLANDSHAVALRYGDRSWTWRAFTARVRAAAGMLDGLGVLPGDRVAHLAGNGPATLEIALACAWIGAVYVPINGRATEGQAAYIVDDSSAPVLLAGDGRAERMSRVRVLMPHLRELVDMERSYELLLADAPTVTRRVEVTGEAPFCQLYASGRDGFPRGAVLTHAAMASVCDALADAIGLTPSGVSLVVTPMFRVAALSQALMAARHGAETVIMPEVTAAAVLDAIESRRVTHTFVPPTLLAAMAAEPGAADRDLTSVVNLAYGAAPMPPSMIRAVGSVLHANLLQVYGITEAAGATTVLVAADHADDVRVASAGRPLPGVRLRISDPDSGDGIPDGVVGEVQVSTARAMTSYWRQPEETAAVRTPDGWLRTGDRGYLDADGYLYLVGRLTAR